MRRLERALSLVGRPRLGLALLGLLLVAAAGLGLDRLLAEDSEGFVIAALLQGALYLAGVWWIGRPGAGKGMILTVLVIAALLRAAALPAPPFLSTDAYRYVWDGRVQAAGVNPYRYVPSDPALTPLRDAEVYPNISRRNYAPTIYPPAAQLVFLLVTRFGENLLTMKLAMVAFEALTMAAIIVLLQRSGEPVARVLVYAWHPLPVWEFAGTGHIDVAAITFLCLALVAADRKRFGLAGAAVAAGMLIKPFPLAVAPALWRRWDWKMPAAALLTAAVLYIPYLGVGTKVLGFLGGYGGEEGYDDGSGFYLVALMRALGLGAPSGRAYLASAAVIYAALAAVIALHPRAERWRSNDPVALGSTFLILASPHYAWYFAWVIPLLCRAFYPPLLYMTLAAFLIYLPRTTFLGSRLVVDSVIYGGFALLALGGLVVKSVRVKGGTGEQRERPNCG